MCYSFDWWEQMFAPAYSLDQNQFQLLGCPESCLQRRGSRAAQRKWKGRLLSHKPAQTRSRQKLLA